MEVDLITCHSRFAYSKIKLSINDVSQRDAAVRIN